MGRRRQSRSDDNIDSKVVCPECGEIKWINFIESLTRGWPICCGVTMEMAETQADFEKEIDDVLSKRKIRLRSKYSERRYIP